MKKERRQRLKVKNTGLMFHCDANLLLPLPTGQRLDDKRGDFNTTELMPKTNRADVK